MGRRLAGVHSMSDTNPLQSLNMATQKVTNEIMYLRDCKKKLEFELSEEKKKIKNLEEALYCETLSKVSERNKSEASVIGLLFWSIVMFVIIAERILGFGYVH